MLPSVLVALVAESLTWYAVERGIPELLSYGEKHLIISVEPKGSTAHRQLASNYGGGGLGLWRKYASNSHYWNE